MDLDTALEWSATAATISENSEDHRESIDAFNEKRPAKFRGRQNHEQVVEGPKAKLRLAFYLREGPHSGPLLAMRIVAEQ